MVQVDGKYLATVDENTVLLKDNNGLPFIPSIWYKFRVIVVWTDKEGLEHNWVLFRQPHIFSPLRYNQDDLEKWAERVAARMNGSEPVERNLTDVLVDVSQTWSYNFEKLVLIISDDASVFAANVGAKKNSKLRPLGACKTLDNPTAKCEQIALKIDQTTDYVFGICLLKIMSSFEFNVIRKKVELSNRSWIAVIVPYRNRERHLKKFFEVMPNYLRTRNIGNNFYVIEQNNEDELNRGALRNIGFIEAR
ncbi:hypothetical protein Ciccas_002515 [Cichlidogyrus casuarinus]|uniref:Galactosyltransferase N-terminal domain-containing protein n=1 Tax=Cichlidogyrus casuarinus TaxID=1844966 RepID=A0ABD2QH89_9PLAT